MRFENEVVVVTGAASGIGRAVCVAAAGEGARVAAIDMNERAGAEVASEVGGIFLAGDVGDPEQFNANAQSIVEQLGPPDRVHLNAGIMTAPTGEPEEAYSFDALTLDRYNTITRVNIDGVVFGLMALLPHMKAGSSIVVTASLAGLVPYGYDPIYAMTKHAMVGLVRSLGGELASKGVRINAICPGGVNTAIIPVSQQLPEALMTPETLAADVLDLFDGDGTGEAWARVRENKPAYVMQPPGARRPQ